MNSIMQCLNSVKSFAEYFINDAYCRDIDSRSKYGGTFASEIGASLKMMNKGSSPVSLNGLKTTVGRLHYPFAGFVQHDSHEFLLLLIDWLFEDLSGDATSVPTTVSVNMRKPFTLDTLFHGINQFRIICRACQYESLSFEPFTIMSLSLPSSGRCTLEELLKNAYEAGPVDYKCPQCNTHGECTQKSEIKKLPSVLILHLKRFDNFSRKMENIIEFPLVNLSLISHATSSARNPAFYNLCAVTDHYGTLAAGHYNSLCRSWDGDTWYKCDDQNVNKTRMSGISNSAYLLFYELATTV